MLRIQRILCPVDFSECSTKAYDYAYSLALRYRAKLYVEHVIQILTAAYPYYNFPDVAGNNIYWDLSRGAESRLQEMVKHRSMNGLEAEMVVHKGFVPESILSYAQNLQADMIVMGTHGRRGLDRLVMGSVTESVLRKARCPVRERSVFSASGLMSRATWPLHGIRHYIHIELGHFLKSTGSLQQHGVKVMDTQRGWSPLDPDAGAVRTIFAWMDEAVRYGRGSLSRITVKQQHMREIGMDSRAVRYYRQLEGNPHVSLNSAILKKAWPSLGERLQRVGAEVVLRSAFIIARTAVNEAAIRSYANHAIAFVILPRIEDGGSASAPIILSAARGRRRARRARLASDQLELIVREDGTHLVDAIRFVEALNASYNHKLLG